MAGKGRGERSALKEAEGDIVESEEWVSPLNSSEEEESSSESAGVSSEDAGRCSWFALRWRQGERFTAAHSEAASSTDPRPAPSRPEIGNEEIDQLSINPRIQKKWWKLLFTYLKLRKWQRIFNNIGKQLQTYPKEARDRVSRIYPKQK